jgi:hypothetical protein
VVMTGASLSTNNHLPGQSLSQSQLSSLRNGSHHAANLFEQTRETRRSDSSNSLRLAGKAGAQQRTNTVSTQHKSPPNRFAKMGSWLEFLESDVDECSQNSSEEHQHQRFEDSDTTVIRAHNLSPYAPLSYRQKPSRPARKPSCR